MLIPINLDTVNIFQGLDLGLTELEAYFESIAEKLVAIRTSEDVVVSRVDCELYEKCFADIPASSGVWIPRTWMASVTARIPVYLNRDNRYFSGIYQAMPLHGFTRMFQHA